MNFNVEQLPAQPVIYMRRIGAYGVENHKLMETLKEWANQRSLLEDSIIYGIAQDTPANVPQEQCRYDVCLALADACLIDETVQQGKISGGKYAVFTLPHTVAAVQEFWASGFQLLQQENLRIDETKPILERYEYKLVEAGQCEFCIPIV